jgi:hypothetical protein
VVDVARLHSVLSRLSDANGLSESTGIEDMSDRAFAQRHRRLEKDEARIREEERSGTHRG